MNLQEKAYEKGAQFAREGLPLERALDRCPWSTVAARSSFINGWKSAQTKEPK